MQKEDFLMMQIIYTYVTYCFFAFIYIFKELFIANGIIEVRLK